MDEEKICDEKMEHTEGRPSMEKKGIKLK